MPCKKCGVKKTAKKTATKKTKWGDPGLIDSVSGCNIEPEESIGYYREEAAEDLYA
jgi:hypothetical protein